MPDIGCWKNQLETPALSVDIDKMDRNIRTVAARCKQAGVGWRPHAKCHKSPTIASRLVDAGAIGVTCAKLGEAEVLADDPVRDILIANFIVGQGKIQRLVELRKRCDLIVCTDHADQLAPLGRAMEEAALVLRVLVEVDIGMQRAGVRSVKSALELARQVAERPGLRLAGVMGYEGHLLQIEDPCKKQALIHQSLDILGQAADQFTASGLPCPIVSCGGTGSYMFSIEHPAITEVQAGGAIFMDQFYQDACQVTDLEPALTVLATVVSCPAPDRAITDAGRKTMDSQICLPRVLDHPGVSVEYLSAEHGVLQLTAEAEPLKVGQRLEFVPGYVDFTTVLHDNFQVIQNERLVDVWPLTARGELQ